MTFYTTDENTEEMGCTIGETAKINWKNTK